MGIAQPPIIGPDVSQWARQFSKYVQTNLAKLSFKVSGDSAAENGVILWDNGNEYPVVSRSDAFTEVVLKVTAPSSSVGAAGDKAGLFSFDTNYIYICTGSHDGSTAIWKRVALASY